MQKVYPSVVRANRATNPYQWTDSSGNSMKTTGADLITPLQVGNTATIKCAQINGSDTLNGQITFKLASADTPNSVYGHHIVIDGTIDGTAPSVPIIVVLRQGSTVIYAYETTISVSLLHLDIDIPIAKAELITDYTDLYITIKVHDRSTVEVTTLWIDTVYLEIPVASGYQGAATFDEPGGADNFVTLGADNTGVSNCEDILRDWYDAASAGDTLYIPAGTYNLTYVLGTSGGILVNKNISIIGAGEDLVTLVMSPNDTTFTIAIMQLTGGCDVVLKGFHVIGPTMTGQIPYEQVVTNIVYAPTVVSSTPTNLTVDHVTWEKMTMPWMFFAGATTPTNFTMTNFEGRTYWQHISYYRGDNNYHHLNLRYGSFLKWGLPAASNPYTPVDVGHAVYTHANLNFEFEGVLWDNAEQTAWTVSGYSLKCGGSGDVTAVPTHQELIDCEFAAEAGGIQLDGKRRTKMTRVLMINNTDQGISQFGGVGIDCVDCKFHTESIQFSANQTYNFTDCSFIEANLYAYNAGVVINIDGGYTHWKTTDVAPGYLIRAATQSTIIVNVSDHDFWSEITDQGGNAQTFYVGAGTWNFSNCWFRGAWRTTTSNAIFQITADSTVKLVSLVNCKCDIGNTKYLANIAGPHGYSTFYTYGTQRNGALVSDTSNEWVDHPNPATLSPALWLKADAGVITDAAGQFTAANSEYLSRASESALQTGDIDYCFAVWIRLDSLTAPRTAVARWSGTTNEFGLDVSAAGAVTFGIQAVSIVTATTFGNISANTDYLVIVGHNATTDKWFISINAGSEDEAADTGIPAAGTSVFSVGTYGSGGGQFWNGRISRLGFWKRILTSAERTWLYNSGTGRFYEALGVENTNGANLKTNLIEYWNLSEASGTRVGSHAALNLTDNNTVTSNPGPGEGSAQNNSPDEDWTDSSGNSHDANADGAFSTNPLYVATIINGRSVLRFDGSDDYLKIVNHADFKPMSDGWTVAFVGKMGASDSGDWPQIIGSRPWTTGTDKGWAVSYHASTDDKIGAHFADGAVGFDVGDATSTTAFSSAAFQIWLVEFDRAAGKVRFYLNNALDAEITPAAFPSADIDQTNHVYIGREIDGGNSRKAAMDLPEVIVWRGTLAAVQRTALFYYLNSKYAVYS